MARGSSMFPAALWPVLIEGGVDPQARWLFACLFLHPETDTAGFFAWQPRQLATITGLSPKQVESAADHLQEKGLLAVDRDMERAWLAPFIEYDTGAKPNMYVAAMRSIRVCSSRQLKAAAWREIERIHPPPVKFKESTSEQARARMLAERDQAYEELRLHIERVLGVTVPERLPNGSGTIAEPPAVPEPAPGGVAEPGDTPAANRRVPPDDDVGLCTNGCDAPAGVGPRGVYCQTCAEDGAAC